MSKHIWLLFQSLGTFLVMFSPKNEVGLPEFDQRTWSSPPIPTYPILHDDHPLWLIIGGSREVTQTHSLKKSDFENRWIKRGCHRDFGSLPFLKVSNIMPHCRQHESFLSFYFFSSCLLVQTHPSVTVGVNSLFPNYRLIYRKHHAPRHIARCNRTRNLQSMFIFWRIGET